MGRNGGSTQRKTPLKLRLRRTLNLFPLSNHRNSTTKKIQKLKKRKNKNDDDDFCDSGTATTSKPHLHSCSMSHPLSHSKQCSASALMQNTDPSNSTDAIIITSLPTLPFCCHEHLLSMDSAQLGLVAKAMNGRLPRALRISDMSVIESGNGVGMRDVREAIEFLVGIRRGDGDGDGHSGASASRTGAQSPIFGSSVAAAAASYCRDLPFDQHPSVPQYRPSAIPRPQRRPRASISRPTSPSSPPTKSPLRPIHLSHSNFNCTTSPTFQPLYSPTSLTRLEELDESSATIDRNSAFEGFTIKRKLSRKRKMTFSDTVPAITTVTSSTKRTSLPNITPPDSYPNASLKRRRLDVPPKTTMTPAHLPTSPSTTNSTITNTASSRPRPAKSNTISKIPLRSKTTSHLHALHRPNEARSRARNRISSAPAASAKFEMRMTEDVGRGAVGGSCLGSKMGGDATKKRKRDVDAGVDKEGRH